jgi:F-type H+-transporting ATPase subunit delta
MAEIATIARPYAEALFALADKANDLAGWSNTLGALAQIAGHPEVRALIGNPKVQSAQLSDLVASLAPDGLSAEAKSFVQTMVANGRLAALPEVYAQYETLKNERESKVDAHISSAFEISSGELQALVSDLERRFKRKVHPIVTVDRGLIGGARVVVGDEVIDGSVRGKLATMASSLTAP